MRKKGYSRVTIREICKAAGVSIGTFYVYFANKSDLFQDIHKESDTFFRETVAKELESGSAEQKIMNYVGHYARLNIRTGETDMKILYTTENTWFSRHRPMQQVLVEIVQKGQENGELCSDMTSQEIVDMIFVFMRGCCYDWCMKKGSFDLEKRMTLYLGKLIQSLKK